MLIIKPITSKNNQTKTDLINAKISNLTKINSIVEDTIEDTIDDKATDNPVIAESTIIEPIMADPITVTIKQRTTQTLTTPAEEKQVDLRRPIIKQTVKEPIKPNIDTIADLLMLELDRIGEPYILDAIGPSAYTILNEGYGLSSFDEIASSIQFYIAEVKREYPRWFSMCECDVN